ncbi:MAG: DUF885 domain-containing protein [Verrucomicrobiae bacterium]|nr:DUF885 domain-containing protein [Verrucomicrobiae bacterium]
MLRAVAIAAGLAAGVFGFTATPAASGAFDAAFEALMPPRGPTNSAERLRALYDLSWRHRLFENPEMATAVGHPGLNHRWSDLSEEAFARRRREASRPLRILATVDPATLSPDEHLYRDLFERQVREQMEGDRFPEELLAINQMWGPQQEIAQIFSVMPLRTRRDADDYLARLHGIAPRLVATEALLRRGLERGITPPRITLRDVPQQVLNNVPEDPDRSPLLRPLLAGAGAIPGLEAESLLAAARSVFTNAVDPGFRALHRFLVEDYLPRARETTAATLLPDGVDWYGFRVRQYTTTRMTPAEIHELGVSEVRRIRAEMDRIIEQSGFRGSYAEFLEFLRTDPQFYFERGSELLAGYRDIAKRVDLALPGLFGRLPRLPYGVLPIPSHAEQSQTTAYYQPGAAGFGRPGVFYANTYALNMRPKWEMEALTIHEAVPGHHLQIALAQELEDVPEFQKHAGVTAFVEGWALYSERLGPALGMYTDPYSRFGQLTYEMWRAIRLVVDTGMHALGWTREEAIEFFRSHSGKTGHDIVVEVDRYLVWPGQALAYKIGELKIRELRDHAERALGDRFDVRAFHDALLGRGALPLEILEPRMRAWVADQMASEP